MCIRDSIRRYNLLKSCFVPDNNFDFPVSSVPGIRKFLKKWLEQFDWLRYSKTENGGFCLPCSIFPSLSPKFRRNGSLVSKPVCGSKSAIGIFKKHEDAKNGLHAECLKLQQEFLLRYDGKVVPINSLIDSVRREQREKAKSVLPSIVDTVILCGHIAVSYTHLTLPTIYSV